MWFCISSRMSIFRLFESLSGTTESRYSSILLSILSPPQTAEGANPLLITFSTALEYECQSSVDLLSIFSPLSVM